MAGRTGRATNESSFTKDTKNIITNPDDIEDVERKDQYLKRIKKEDEDNKRWLVKVDEWIEVVGYKVLRKVKNKAGSEYTFYLFITI